MLVTKAAAVLTPAEADCYSPPTQSRCSFEAGALRSPYFIISVSTVDSGTDTLWIQMKNGTLVGRRFARQLERQSSSSENVINTQK